MSKLSLLMFSAALRPVNYNVYRRGQFIIGKVKVQKYRIPRKIQ